MRNKFRAIKTQIGERVFASKAEAARYVYLQQLEDEDAIYQLECQPKFQLYGKGREGVKYVADFSYWKRTPNKPTCAEHIVEDVKGFLTRNSKDKIKAMKALLNIDVQIIKMNPRTVDALIKGYLGARK